MQDIYREKYKQKYIHRVYRCPYIFKDKDENSILWSEYFESEINKTLEEGIVLVSHSIIFNVLVDYRNQDYYGVVISCIFLVP